MLHAVLRSVGVEVGGGRGVESSLRCTGDSYPPFHNLLSPISQSLIKETNGGVPKTSQNLKFHKILT
jgi:hypothetical protein